MSKLHEDLLDKDWIKTTLADCQVGDEVVSTDPCPIRGIVTRAGEEQAVVDGRPWYLDHSVLRAPRPEPTFEQGEVWWCRDNKTGVEGGLVHALEEPRWVGQFETDGPCLWMADQVTPLRKLLNADGTAPIAPSLRERLLDEETVEAVARAAWEEPDRDPWKDRAEDTKTLARKVAQLYLATAADVLDPVGERA